MVTRKRIAVLILSVATICSNAVGADAIDLRFHPEIGKKQTMRITSRMVTTPCVSGLMGSDYVRTFTVELEPTYIYEDGSVIMRVSILRVRYNYSSSTDKSIEDHFDSNGRHELNRYAGKSIAFQGEYFAIVVSPQGQLIRLNTDKYYAAVAENRITHEDQAMLLNAEIEGIRKHKNDNPVTRSRQIIANAEKAMRETNEKYGSRKKRKETYKAEAAEYRYYGTIALRMLFNNFLAQLPPEPVQPNDSWPGLVMFSLAYEGPMQLPCKYTLKAVENGVCTIQVDARRNVSDMPIGMSPDEGSMHFKFEGAYQATIKVDQTTGLVLGREAVMDLIGTWPVPPEQRAKFGNDVPIKSRVTITVEKDVHEDVPKKRSLKELRSNIYKTLEKLNTLN